MKDFEDEKFQCEEEESEDEDEKSEGSSESRKTNRSMIWKPCIHEFLSDRLYTYNVSIMSSLIILHTFRCLIDNWRLI